jgi:hypothetical protein
MSWQTIRRLGIALAAIGILANLRDIKRYIRISTM